MDPYLNIIKKLGGDIGFLGIIYTLIMRGAMEGKRAREKKRRGNIIREAAWVMGPI